MESVAHPRRIIVQILLKFFSSSRPPSLWFSLAKIVVEDCDHGQNFNENCYVDTAQWTQINLFLARFSIPSRYLITSQSNLTTYAINLIQLVMLMGKTFLKTGRTFAHIY